MRDFLVKLLSSFFYIGRLPLMPGAFGSLGAAALIWICRGSAVIYFALTVVFLVLGFFVSGSAEKAFGKKDAECIVIDEVAGMFLSLLFLPVNLTTLFCAFILFRAFDSLKIYPADKVQLLGGSRGVMFDDIIAGIYSNLILQVVLRLPR